MSARRPARIPRIDSFALQRGRTLAGKYVVEVMLGAGWEGEVYKVRESRTGITRAAKLFFPQRNVNDRAVKFYAKKLERLRDCSIVIHYMHSEVLRFRRTPVTCLLSEYVEGELFGDFVASRRGKRLPPFEALHLLHALARGVETIHRLGDYHGDLHDGNILVRRHGLFFDVKVVDFFEWGRPTRAHQADDAADLVRLFYDALGGAKHYAAQMPEVKAICCGLRRDLLRKKFPSAGRLREYLETFSWSG